MRWASPIPLLPALPCAVGFVGSVRFSYYVFLYSLCRVGIRLLYPETLGNTMLSRLCVGEVGSRFCVPRFVCDGPEHTPLKCTL